jgi:hypothetical protein
MVRSSVAVATKQLPISQSASVVNRAARRPIRQGRSPIRLSGPTHVIAEPSAGPVSASLNQGSAQRQHRPV